MTKLYRTGRAYAWDALLVALIIGGWFGLTTVLVASLRAAGVDLEGVPGTWLILACLAAVVGVALRCVRSSAYDSGFDDGCDLGPNGKQFGLGSDEVPF